MGGIVVVWCPVYRGNLRTHVVRVWWHHRPHRGWSLVGYMINKVQDRYLKSTSVLWRKKMAKIENVMLITNSNHILDNHPKFQELHANQCKKWTTKLSTIQKYMALMANIISLRKKDCIKLHELYGTWSLTTWVVFKLSWPRQYSEIIHYPFQNLDFQ